MSNDFLKSPKEPRDCPKPPISYDEPSKPLVVRRTPESHDNSSGTEWIEPQVCNLPITLVPKSFYGPDISKGDPQPQGN